VQTDLADHAESEKEKAGTRWWLGDDRRFGLADAEPRVSHVDWKVLFLDQFCDGEAR
jgi:hypothetical protein